MRSSGRICFAKILRFFLKNSRCLAFAMIVFIVILLLRIMNHQDADRHDLGTLLKALDVDQGVVHSFEDPGEHSGSFKSALMLNENSLTGSPKCLLLQLDPLHSGITQFMKDMGKLHCEKRYHSKLRHMQFLVEGKGIREVSYRPIFPPKDGNISTGFETGEAKNLISTDEKLDRGKEGNIQHALGKCIHPLGGYSNPPEGTKLCLYDECGGQEKLIFQMANDGIIKHKASGMCVTPRSLKKAEDRQETFLIFTKKCDEWTSFKALNNGMVQHMKSKMCIHYQSAELTPPNDVPLVLHPNCHDKGKHRFHWHDKSHVNKDLSIRRDVREEFLEVTLQSSSTVVGEVDREYLMQISPNFDLKEPPASEKRLNFLMLMLRSTSMAHFMRKMPMSFNFLKNRIDSIFFWGYSVVDESTRGQLAALLAGISPNDFASKSIDSCPWLFKIAKNNGYVTMVTDDKPYSPMFQDTLSGFKTKPAHHYTSPFWSAATRQKSRIYLVVCDCGKCFVGQTGQTADCRIKEQKI